MAKWEVEKEKIRFDECNNCITAQILKILEDDDLLASEEKFNVYQFFKESEDFNLYREKITQYRKIYIHGISYYESFSPFHYANKELQKEDSFIYRGLRVFCQFKKENDKWIYINGKEEYANQIYKSDCTPGYPKENEKLKIKYAWSTINFEYADFKNSKNDKDENIEIPSKKIQTDYEMPSIYCQYSTTQYVIVKFPQLNSIVYPYRCDGKARSGYKDRPFKEELEGIYIKETGIQIIGNASMHFEEGKYPCEPDIAIVIENTSIRIDIEIDEPYNAKGKPIHYIECGDEERDQKFTDNGWIVIRFTEKQVHEQSKKCIAFIANLISEITTYSIPDKLKDIDNPNIEDRWTKSKAENWVKEKYREKYLDIDKFGNQSINSYYEDELRLNENEQIVNFLKESSSNSNQATTCQDNMSYPKPQDLPFNNIQDATRKIQELDEKEISKGGKMQYSSINWLKRIINKLCSKINI